MSNRRRLAREKLEYYLVYLILAYRRLILLAGLIVLVYAIAILFINLASGYFLLAPAVFLLLLSNSFNMALYTARFAAWMVTLWPPDD